MSNAKKPATAGSWKPGQSGNPGGRAKGIERQVRELIGDDFPALIAAQKRIALGLPPEQAPELEVKAADATRAFAELMDRGYGKAKQTINLTDEPDAADEPDWDAVPLEKRRELLETLTLIAPAEGDASTEH